MFVASNPIWSPCRAHMRSRGVLVRVFRCNTIWWVDDQGPSSGAVTRSNEQSSGSKEIPQPLARWGLLAWGLRIRSFFGELRVPGMTDRLRGAAAVPFTEMIDIIHSYPKRRREELLINCIRQKCWFLVMLGTLTNDRIPCCNFLNLNVLQNIIIKISTAARNHYFCLTLLINRTKEAGLQLQDAKNIYPRLPPSLQCESASNTPHYNFA